MTSSEVLGLSDDVVCSSRGMNGVDEDGTLKYLDSSWKVASADIKYFRSQGR